MTFLLSLNKKLAKKLLLFTGFCARQFHYALFAAEEEDAMHAAKFRQQKPNPYPQLRREKLRQ